MVVELAVTGLSALVQPTFIIAVYWFGQSLATIFSIWGKGDRSQDENDFNNLLDKEQKPKTYDFIVGKYNKNTNRIFILTMIFNKIKILFYV